MKKTFNQIYQQIYNSIFSNKQTNLTIGILVGSFRIPYIYDINLINEYLEFCDKVIIDISSISQKKISRRSLSKTNIQTLAKIFSKISTTNAQIQNKIESIKQNINNISYYKLKKQIIQLCNLIEQQNICDKLQNYLESVQKKIFSSIKYLNNKQITAESIKQIFEIMFDNNPKIQIIIAKETSPLIDIINIINENYENCDIYLDSLENNKTKNTTWSSLIDNFDNINKVLQYYPITKQKITRDQILKNYDKLSDIKIFGNLDKFKVQKIRNILNG